MRSSLRRRRFRLSSWESGRTTHCRCILLTFIRLPGRWRESRGYRCLAAKFAETCRWACKCLALRLGKGECCNWHRPLRKPAAPRCNGLSADPASKFLPETSMPSLDPILEKLAVAQERPLRAADAIPADLWNTPPRKGCWSAAEVIAHVTTIERTVIVVAGKILKKQPKQIPLLN